MKPQPQLIDSNVKVVLKATVAIYNPPPSSLLNLKHFAFLTKGPSPSPYFPDKSVPVGQLLSVNEDITSVKGQLCSIHPAPWILVLPSLVTD